MAVVFAITVARCSRTMFSPRLDVGGARLRVCVCMCEDKKQSQFHHEICVPVYGVQYSDRAHIPSLSLCNFSMPNTLISWTGRVNEPTMRQNEIHLTPRDSKYCKYKIILALEDKYKQSAGKHVVNKNRIVHGSDCLAAVAKQQTKPSAQMREREWGGGEGGSKSA